MLRNHFYRNIHARDLLDAFLISAIMSVLLLRFYLFVTGYPQLGGGPLHIAHMLYGGLFMMIAIVVCLTFLGRRAKQFSAIIGGVGFGIFIDELGKFITKDNNYFFQPTIGLIYAIFVAMYLTFSYLTRKKTFTSREYQLNALGELEEAIAHDLDKNERARIHKLLAASNSQSAITKKLSTLVESLEITAEYNPSRMDRLRKRIDNLYIKFWKDKRSKQVALAIFSFEISLLVTAALYTVYDNIDELFSLLDGGATYRNELLIGQVLSSIISVGFVVYGVYLLKQSRRQAFEQLRRALLINIYVTQFFLFIRDQFDALPGMLVSLVLLLLITFVLRQEERLGNDSDK